MTEAAAGRCARWRPRCKRDRSDGRCAPPGRTLTFIWGDENCGSRHWLAQHPDQAKGVQYMFSLDMTGEDTAKTGGTFLIEKQAGSVRRLAAPVRSAYGVGRRRGQARRIAEGQPAQRPAPRDLPAPRAATRAGS